VKLVTTAEMRSLEARAEAAGVSTAQLMENAGLASAQEAWMLLGTLEDRVIVVLVGPGNNGGDGLVAARHLYDWGAEVHAYLTRARGEDEHLHALTERSVPVVIADDDPDGAKLDPLLRSAHLIVDAILGTGRARPIDGTIARILDGVTAVRASALPPKLLAIDLPSGLDADTGMVDPHTPSADETVTFGAAKVGLYSVPGSLRAGRIEVVDIGIPASALTNLPLTLLTSAWTRERLPTRPANSNKGSFGKVMAVTGSSNFVGAAYLSAASAYRTGAGLVTLAVPRTIQLALVPMTPEATFLPLADDDGALVSDGLPRLRQSLAGYDAVLVGCGVGQSAYAQQFVRSLLFGLDVAEPQGLVVDADGLNALAAQEDWWERLKREAILTPHPGEFARLTHLSVSEVQADRLGLSLRFARMWNKVVVLKGANTVIASPDGTAMLSPFANPALATAGTGDVLAGTIAGLLAQGMALAEAAAAGVYVHGAAGELLSQEFGDAGGLAADLLRLLPMARREILRTR
jgi:hydroxyethylthiazole kinase-like uncharacterized protein yjeF